MMTLGPFDYSNMDEIDLLCRLPDQFIRQVCRMILFVLMGMAKGALWLVRSYLENYLLTFSDHSDSCHNTSCLKVFFL